MGDSSTIDWRKLFAARSDQSLDIFFQPELREGVVTVKPPPEVFAEGLQTWRFTLRLAYAKVCVEVSTTSSIPSFVDVILQNDFSVSIGVGVPWLLPKCIKCSVFGHSNNACFVDPVGHVMAKGDTRKAVVVGKVKQKQSVSHFDLGPSRSGLEGLLGVAVIPFPTKSGKVNARGSNNQFAILSDDVNLVASIVDVNPAIDVCGDSVGDVFVFASDALGSEAFGVERIVDVSSFVGGQVVGEGVDGHVKDHVLSPRKMWIASHGVAQLIQEMKARKKGHVEKGRKKSHSGPVVVSSQSPLI
ncbi:hypothetical protein V6N13_072785 [Hibiscus sabdariffa]